MKTSVKRAKAVRVTPKQYQVWCAIEDAMNANPWAPSHREVAAVAGMDAGNMHKIVKQLEVLGVVKQTPGRARSLELLLCPPRRKTA